MEYCNFVKCCTRCFIHSSPKKANSSRDTFHHGLVHRAEDILILNIWEGKQHTPSTLIGFIHFCCLKYQAGYFCLMLTFHSSVRGRLKALPLILSWLISILKLGSRRFCRTVETTSSLRTWRLRKCFRMATTDDLPASPTVCWSNLCRKHPRSRVHHRP